MVCHHNYFTAKWFIEFFQDEFDGIIMIVIRVTETEWVFFAIRVFMGDVLIIVKLCQN